MKAYNPNILPPCIDTVGTDDMVWTSSLIPIIPVADNHDNEGRRVKGFVLSAWVHVLKTGNGYRKYVELRLKEEGANLTGGEANLDGFGRYIAWGSIPIDEFLKATELEQGKCCYSVRFYDGQVALAVEPSAAAGMITASVVRGCSKEKAESLSVLPQMVVRWETDGRSFQEWRDGLANTAWTSLAREYAAKVGVSNFSTNGKLLEYWAHYVGDGWYFVRYDLEKGEEVFRGAKIPWTGEEQIPAFLKDASGKHYNYM